MHLTLSYVNRYAVYDAVQQLFNLFYIHLCVSDKMKAGQVQAIWKQNRMGTMINTFVYLFVLFFFYPDLKIRLNNRAIFAPPLQGKYTNPAYQHSHFCKQKLTAPPSVPKSVAQYTGTLRNVQGQGRP